MSELNPIGTLLDLPHGQFRVVGYKTNGKGEPTQETVAYVGPRVKGKPKTAAQVPVAPPIRSASTQRPVAKPAAPARPVAAPKQRPTQYRRPYQRPYREPYHVTQQRLSEDTRTAAWAMAFLGAVGFVVAMLNAMVHH